MGASGFTLIDDTGLSCIASGLGGVIRDEAITIANLCQDPDNLNICYMDISASGPYNYFITVMARYLPYNSGGSFYTSDWIDITNSFIEGYGGSQDPNVEWSNDPGTQTDSRLRFNTFCSSLNTRIGFNCGHLIDDDMSSSIGPGGDPIDGNFASLAKIEFQIHMIGQFPDEAFENTGGCHNPQLEEDMANDINAFDSIDPSSNIYLYNKGVTPDPYFIYFDPITNELKIVYANLGTEPCACAINCVTPEIDDFDLPVCDEELQIITVDANDIIGDPTNIQIIFKDSIGNLSDLSVHTVAGVKPRTLGVLVEPKPLHAQIGIHYASINATQIKPDKVKYQILKYTDNADNFIILKDWSSKKWDMVYDKKLRVGHTYGYAVKFKGEFGEESYLSDWKTIVI